MWRVNIMMPDGKIQAFDFMSGEVTIGRGPECDLVIDDRSVSRSHMKVIVTEASLEIVDLHSTNGVFVNGEQIEGQRTLESGDKVTLGRIDMTFSLLDGWHSMSPGGAKRKTVFPKPALAEFTQIGSPHLENIPLDNAEVETTRVNVLQLHDPEMGFGYPGADADDARHCKLFVYLKRRPAVYEFTGKQLNIGRTADNEVVIDHDSVSRNHARIVSSGSSYILHDLGSSNGTSVNDQPIRKRYLSPGDKIYFGAVPARFSAKDEGPLEMKKAEEPVKVGHQESSSGLLKLLLFIAAIIFAMIFFSEQISQVTKGIKDYTSSVNMNTK